jgi:hypothetical protein
MGTSRVWVTFVVLAALTFLTAHGSMAQDQSGQTGQRGPRMMCMDRFASLDANGDGRVDRGEFMSVDHRGGNAEQVFESRDANSDGALTKDEFCSGRGMRRGRMQ